MAKRNPIKYVFIKLLAWVLASVSTGCQSETVETDLQMNKIKSLEKQVEDQQMNLNQLTDSIKNLQEAIEANKKQLKLEWVPIDLNQSGAEACHRKDMKCVSIAHAKITQLLANEVWGYVVGDCTTELKVDVLCTLANHGYVSLSPTKLTRDSKTKVSAHETYNGKYCTNNMPGLALCVDFGPRVKNP